MVDIDFFLLLILLVIEAVLTEWFIVVCCRFAPLLWARAESRNNKYMPLFKFQAMFKESVQKATSGFSIPSENELYGARGNRTWRNTTEFERKRAPPPVSDHHDPVHWRAWKMLRKVRSGIHLLSI